MARKPQPKPRDDVPPDSPPDRSRADALPDELRRRDQSATAPDSLPPNDEDVTPLAGDGGNPDHPVHDDDVEDLDSAGFEAEVDDVEGPADEPAFDRAEEIAPLLDRKP